MEFKTVEKKTWPLVSVQAYEESSVLDGSHKSL